MSTVRHPFSRSRSEDFLVEFGSPITYGSRSFDDHEEARRFAIKLQQGGYTVRFVRRVLSEIPEDIVDVIETKG